MSDLERKRTIARGGYTLRRCPALPSVLAPFSPADTLAIPAAECLLLVEADFSVRAAVVIGVGLLRAQVQNGDQC